VTIQYQTDRTCLEASHRELNLQAKHKYVVGNNNLLLNRCFLLLYILRPFLELLGLQPVRLREKYFGIIGTGFRVSRMPVLSPG